MEIFVTENSPSEMLTLIVKDHFDIQNSKIKYLKDVIDYFLTDKVRLKNLVNNIPFDEDVDFEFINNKS